MTISIYTVDAFCGGPGFRGNPAAVCLLDDATRSTEWMQSIASEMNLSETAFVKPSYKGNFSLRWFTPTTEVALCGHATLASAHVLWETRRSVESEVKFHTNDGSLLPVRKKETDIWIEMDFPAFNLKQLPKDTFPTLAKGLGAKPESIGENKARSTLLIELDSEETLRDLKPDFSLLLQKGKLQAKLLICTAAASPKRRGCDFVVRVFAPGLGINEDPVTGSAQCFLAPFWEKRMRKSNFLVHQISRRGGVLRVGLVADIYGRTNHIVKISGCARTIIRGQLQV